MSKDPCNGCICSKCTLSEKQGNIYGCQKKRCRECTDERYLRLNYCANSVIIEEKEVIIRL